MEPEPVPNPNPETLHPVALDSPPPPSRLMRIFRGPTGLRPFWRLFIFLAIVFGLQFAIHLIFRGPKFPPFTPRFALLQDGAGFLIVTIAATIMARIEKRSFSDYGLPLRGAFGSRFLEGLLWGFLAECATMLILYLAGDLKFAGFELHGLAALYFAVMWGFAFVAVGLFEEFLFRGYPQFTLSTGIGFWPAAFVISGLFWLAHMGNPGETWVGGLATALVALAFCVSLRLTGSLWFAVGMHAAWDWTETYFFGVPDSGIPAYGHLLNSTLSGSKWMTGGSVGPEASVVELILVILLIALLFLRFRRKHAPISPSPTTEQQITDAS